MTKRLDSNKLTTPSVTEHTAMNSKPPYAEASRMYGKLATLIESVFGVS